MLRFEPGASHGLPGRARVFPADRNAPLHRLAGRKLLLVATTLAGLGLAAAYLALVPRNYTSETQIVVDPRGLQVFGQDLTPPGQTSDVNTALIETHLRVLTSDTVLARVVARADLTRDPEFNGSERNPLREAESAFRGWLGFTGPPEAPEIVALRALQDRVRVQRVDRGYVIRIGVTAHNPDKAARLAGALADTYIEEEATARRDLAARAGQELRGRLDELAARVKRAEDAAEAFKVAHGLVGAGSELVSAQELSALNAQLVAAQTRASELKARAEQIQSLARSGSIPDTIAETVGSPTVASLRTQFAEVNRLQADTATRLGPRHPDTIAVRAQVERMRGQINDELTRIARATRGDYERARANEAGLGRQLDALKRRALDVSQSLVRLRELEREAAASRSVYEAFLVRSREIGEQQRVDTANVRVISPALAPNKPNGLPAALIVLAGALIGLAAGVGLASLRGALHGLPARRPVLVA